MVADYTRSDKGATAKVEAKKNLRIRAGWCKRQGTKSVPNNLTNQYLWDLNCINLFNALAIGQSQQPEAKCN